MAPLLKPGGRRLLAAAVPAIISGLLTPINREPINTDAVSVLALALAVYPFALAFACIFGLPLFWVFRRYHLVRWWSAIISGLFAGAAVAIVLVLPHAASAQNVASLAIAGAASALLFYIVWRSSVRA